MNSYLLLCLLPVLALTDAAVHHPREDPMNKGSKIELTSEESTTKFYLDSVKNRMVEVSADQVCKFYGDRDIIQKRIEEVKDKVIIDVQSKEFKEIVGKCYQHIQEKPALYLPQQVDITLVFPGTKWCGAGDIAEDYDDLGILIETDMCCRAHDNCPDVIKRGETKHGIHNEGLVQRSHCDCDNQLKECLHPAKEVLSEILGYSYFSIMGMKCFREDYPIVQCKEYGGLFNRYCQDYELDETQPKIWEFFDDKAYTNPAPTK